jgi:hypothetical protein
MIKFYIASLLAFSDLQFLEGGQTQPGTYSECIPAFIPAESIDEAGESARTYLLERWKPAMAGIPTKQTLWCSAKPKYRPLAKRYRQA